MHGGADNAPLATLSSISQLRQGSNELDSSSSTARSGPVMLSGSLVMLSGSLVILSGSLVILSEAKDLALGSQTFRGVYPEPIRFAQDKLRAWAQGDRV
jgi:hypothetical protein